MRLRRLRIVGWDDHSVACPGRHPSAAPGVPPCAAHDAGKGAGRGGGPPPRDVVGQRHDERPPDGDRRGHRGRRRRRHDDRVPARAGVGHAGSVGTGVCGRGRPLPGGEHRGRRARVHRLDPDGRVPPPRWLGRQGRDRNGAEGRGRDLNGGQARRHDGLLQGGPTRLGDRRRIRIQPGTRGTTPAGVVPDVRRRRSRGPHRVEQCRPEPGRRRAGDRVLLAGGRREVDEHR